MSLAALRWRQPTMSIHTAAALDVGNRFPTEMQSISFWDISTIAVILLAFVLIRIFINFAQQLHRKWSRFELR